MIKELYNDLIYNYCISKEFKIEYLAPVGEFVMWKLKNEWDDYNELYHSTIFFEKVRANKELWIDSHLMLKDSKLIGIGFIIGGDIQSIENRIEIQHERKSLLFKYFHIIEKGKGLGTKWFSKVIFPYYKNLAYHDIYIASSHPKSFSFYEKFGIGIADYKLFSDSKINERVGRIFKVDLSKTEN